jgi:hypothetical protein
MNRWRREALERFVAGVSRLTVAADPDGVLGDEVIGHELAARGFTVLPYGDPVEFRLVYETRWRARWERGSTEALIVRVDGETVTEDMVPFDLVSTARRVSVARASLFPDVPPRLVESLTLDELERIASQTSRGPWDRLDRRARLLAEKLDVLERTVPTLGARPEAWGDYAARWAEMQALRYEEAGAVKVWEARAEVLHDRIEAAFEAWMERHYAALHNLAPVPPVMLHHIPRAMARALERGEASRVALVVLDGMAFDQWIALRAVANFGLLGATEHTSAVYAWVPTTTVVSRQALFAGKLPARFAERLEGTSGERILWEEFWESQGLARDAVGYLRGLGDGRSPELDALVADTRRRALGLVVDKVDRIMHGMELGTAGMHAQVRQWGATGWFTGILRVLLDAGYRVFVTADHGNLEAVGIGKVGDASLADVRGERARVFPNETLRQKVALEVPLARCWLSAGLPGSYLPLVATGRTAFVPEGQHVVGHGGAALEEVVVPLVVFSR